MLGIPLEFPKFKHKLNHDSMEKKSKYEEMKFVTQNIKSQVVSF